jgi:RNA-binding protein
MMLPLTNAKIRELKAKGQHLEPVLKIGKEGLTPEFYAALAEAFNHHELLKVKFAGHKEEKKELAPQIAEKSGSELIMRVGNVLVLYKPKPAAGEPAAEEPAAPAAE